MLESRLFDFWSCNFPFIELLFWQGFAARVGGEKVAVQAQHAGPGSRAAAVSVAAMAELASTCGLQACMPHHPPPPLRKKTKKMK